MSKHAALSPFAFSLPSPARSSAVIEISGRQQIARYGVFFTKVGRWRRSVYQQFDGETILADDCRCEIDFRCDVLTINRSPVCPIDQHRVSMHSFPAGVA